MEVEIAHTADLPRATLEAARELLEVAFEGDMTEHDWEHALGGMHVLVRDAGELVGHGSVSVLEVAGELDVHGELTADWREGDEW